MNDRNSNEFFKTGFKNGRLSSIWRFFPGAALAVFLLFAQALAEAQSSVLSACEIDYPPFCTVDKNGRVHGFSVELLRASLAVMGKEVAFRTGPWAEVKGWLEKGEVEVLPLVGRTPERKGIFDFTFPYMTLHGAIVVREETTDIQEIGDLKGKTVAVMKEDNAEEFLLREERGINLVSTPTFEIALRELSQGRYDAVVIQRLLAIRLIKEAALEGLRIVNKPVEGFRQDFCFAVKKGDDKTLALLNEGLSLVIADGTYRSLHARWFAALELPPRRISVGGAHDCPPYEYLDENGRPAGHNVELTRAIARKLGLDIEIRLDVWGKIIRRLERGEIDVIQGMFYSPGRGKTFDFSQPYLSIHYVAVVRKESGKTPETLEELAGKSIVLQKGGVAHDFLRERGFGDRISTAETQKEVLQKVADGSHDCGIVIRIIAANLIEKQGWERLSLGRIPLFATEYCYAVSKGQKAILAQFSEGLKMVEQSGEYRRIHDKWMGIYENSGMDFIAFFRYALFLIVPLSLLFSLIVLWSWSLKKQVAAKTRSLQESEASLRIAGRLARLGGWCVELGADWAKNRVFWTDEVADIHGMPPGFSPDVGQAIQFYAPRFREKITQVFLACAKEGIPYDEEMQIVTSQGKQVWVRTLGEAERDPSGKIVRVRGGFQDITERKQAEQRIEHLNHLLLAVRAINQLIVQEKDQETMVRNTCHLLVANRGYLSALIVLAAPDDRPFFWHAAGFQTNFESLETKLQQGILPPCFRHIGDKKKSWLVEVGENRCEECPLAQEHEEKRMICIRLSHDEIHFGYLVASLEKEIPVNQEERDLFEEMARDLSYALYTMKREKEHEETERHRESLERQLAQAQKMESIGRLAGGVAHDFNNMLGVIMGYTELVMRKLGSSSSVAEYLDDIHNAATRSAEITRQLLAFARKQTICPKRINLNSTVEETIKMLQRLIGENITLVWTPEEGLWNIHADSTQIIQVLANLCVNARDAIAGVGEIVIETHNVILDDAYCSEHIDTMAGEFVMLSVKDNGCGMDQKTLSHIFEPFFTTKEPGKGTGLGLSTVYGIVKQNNGFIEVQSELGKGSTFNLHFHRYLHPENKTVAKNASELPLGQEETLLLVEDDPLLMEMGTAMLQDFGYLVLSAGTPGKALALAREHAGKIRLLITDVIMPEMNGRELARQIQSLCPGIKILFMSGYTADLIAPHGALEEGVNFISKPFSMNDLAAKVRETMRGE